MTSIRRAKPGDGAALVEMTRALAAAHDALDHFTATAEAFEQALFGPNPIIGALLAEVEGTTAGSAVWHHSFSTNRGQGVMYLEDVSVLEAYRRRGVAKALFRAVAREALEQGYAHVFWMVMDWNTGAKELYRQLGASFETGFNVCRLDDAQLRALAV